MKPTFLLSLLILISTAVNAQTEIRKKINIGIEYSFAFSRVTEHRFGAFNTRGFYPSSNIFLKGGYSISNKMDLTIGAGYIITKDYKRLPFGLEINTHLTESFVSHQYYTFPIGLKYKLNKFFINPEIAFAVNDKHRVTTMIYSLNEVETLITTTDFESQNISYNTLTIPVFLTVGTEIQCGSVNCLIGLKSYYSLTTISASPVRPSRYYGFGVMTGISF